MTDYNDAEKIEKKKNSADQSKRNLSWIKYQNIIEINNSNLFKYNILINYKFGQLYH